MNKIRWWSLIWSWHPLWSQRAILVHNAIRVKIQFLLDTGILPSKSKELAALVTTTAKTLVKRTWHQIKSLTSSCVACCIGYLSLEEKAQSPKKLRQRTQRGRVGESGKFGRGENCWLGNFSSSWLDLSMREKLASFSASRVSRVARSFSAA